jgi:hypothetical protein
MNNMQIAKDQKQSARDKLCSLTSFKRLETENKMITE